MNTLQYSYLLHHVARHDELWQRLVTVWKDLEQHIIDTAVDQWRHRQTVSVQQEADILITTCSNSLSS